MKGFLLTFVALPLALTVARCGELEKNPPFDLTTIYGETFHGCRIYKVTPATVDVVYDSGVAKISFEKLDESWKQHFNYNPEKARAYQKKEVTRNNAATVRLKELRKKQDAAQAKMLELAASMERKQAVADAQRQQAQQDLTTDEVPLLPPLAPYPGEAPAPQTAQAPVPPPAGSQVPIMPPLGPAYTPGDTGYPPNSADPFDGSYDPFTGYGGGYVVGGYGYGHPRFPRYRSPFGSSWGGHTTFGGHSSWGHSYGVSGGYRR